MRWPPPARCRRGSSGATTSAASRSARRRTSWSSTTGWRSSGCWWREVRVSLAKDEIAQQPDVVARPLDREGPAIDGLAAEIRRRAPRYAVLAARGTSDNAARYAQHVLGRILHLPVALATPSLHTLYHAPPRY